MPVILEDATPVIETKGIAMQSHWLMNPFINQRTPFCFLESATDDCINDVHDVILSTKMGVYEKHAAILSYLSGTYMHGIYENWAAQKLIPPIDVLVELDPKHKIDLFQAIYQQKWEWIYELFQFLAPTTQKKLEQWLTNIADGEQLLGQTLEEAQRILIHFQRNQDIIKYKQLHSNVGISTSPLSFEGTVVATTPQLALGVTLPTKVLQVMSITDGDATVRHSNETPSVRAPSAVASRQPLKEEKDKFDTSPKWPTNSQKTKPNIEMGEDALTAMAFLQNLDDKQQQQVMLLGEIDGSLDYKLGILREKQFTEEVIEHVRKFWTKEKEAVPKKKEEATNRGEEVKEEKKLPNFLSLVQEDKRNLIKFYFKRNEFEKLAKRIGSESDECKESFKSFMLQNGHTLPNMEEVKKEPTLQQAPKESNNKQTWEAPDEQPQKNKDPQSKSPAVSPELLKSFRPCTTILVLGETGVGKSTFLNGLVNYLMYANMYKAKDCGPHVLIKSHFTHRDDDMNRMLIECKPTIVADDNNEETVPGQACTQSPKAYQFKWGLPDNERTVRIIDTPGVNDVRGADQEKMNFEKILSYIADYEEINAILILLKPNRSRLTLSFCYCTNELLKHLHVSARKNIMFCFTHARDTYYVPGDTLPALQAHLAELHRTREIEIRDRKAKIGLCCST